MSTIGSLLPQFLRFKDLRAAGITTNWPHLARLIDAEGFPPGRMLSRNLRAWTLEEVQAWIASRPTVGKAAPARRKSSEEISTSA
jgi:predicted DNA-binding transcriptional regulator AlpA